MARQEGRRNIFDVIKVNMFGVKQQRILVLDAGDPAKGVGGRLQICTGNGKVKRDLEVGEIAGIESSSGHGDSEDTERSVTFKFFQSTKDSSRDASSNRTIVFVSKKQRDQFVDLMEKLNPKLVLRDRDGKLTSKSATASADKAAAGAKAAADKSGKLDLDAISGDAKFFSMEENDWGFSEPRVLTFSKDDKSLHIIDATAAGTGTSEFTLRRIMRVSLHAGDKSTAQLSISDGGVVATVTKRVVLSFGGKALRDRFVADLYDKMERAGVKYEVDELWRSVLPTKTFARIECTRLKPRKLPVVLLISVRKRQVVAIRAKEIPGYEAGGAVPNNAPVDEIMRIAPYRLQLERNPRNPRLLSVGDAGPTHAPTTREMSEFEFADGADRERFCGLLVAMACVDTNVLPTAQSSAALILARSLSSTSLGPIQRSGSTLSIGGVSVGGGSDTARSSFALSSGGAGGAMSPGSGSAPLSAADDVTSISKATPGNVRSTFRAPSVGDMSSLWAATWPHDDIKVWVGTYNVSQAPPPDPSVLEKWVAAPSRDPFGGRDVYVFGIQELGTAANREAWSQALVRHLSPSKVDVAAAAAAVHNKAAAAGAKPKGGLSLTAKSSSDKAKDEAETDAAAEVAATAALSASKLSAAETEGAYVLLEYVHMWEMAMWIFIRMPHVVDVTNVTRSIVPTGLAVAKSLTGVQLGNKGGVGIGFRWRDTTMAFVMVHLPARPDLARLRKREADYRRIVRELKVEAHSMGGSGQDFVHTHDHVWFFGDSNYRVELPFDRAVALVKSKQFGGIMAHDQQVKEMGRGRAFVGFSEARVEFAPTYRWERNADEFSWKRGQTPSYTDRVMHRSLPGVADKIVQTAYDSPTTMFGSDHRPVSAGYTVGLRRYYTAPAPPLIHTPYPVPTFFTAVDAALLPVPALILSGLKLASVSALSAPAGIYLKIYFPWSDGAPVVSPIMSAMGLTTQQKEALRTLRVELSEEGKKAKVKAKADAKEARIKSKAEKAARGGANGGSAGSSEGKKPDSSSSSGSAGPSKDGDDDGSDGVDSGDEDDKGLADYTALDEDAQFAAAAAAALDDTSASSSIDPKKKALLTLQAEYVWTPAEMAIPPIRPAIWDPRLLRYSHVHVVAFSAPGADGSFLAIGGGKKLSASSTTGDAVIGQAVIPLLPFIRNAASANEVALSIQNEDDDDDDLTALLNGTSSSSAAASDKREKGAAVPVLPALLEQESIALTTGLVDAIPDRFAKGFNPDGVPWALTAPPVGFRVDCEIGGQTMGKLSGQGALRAFTDPVVARRGGGPGAHIQCRWNFPVALAAVQSAHAANKELAELYGPAAAPGVARGSPTSQLQLGSSGAPPSRGSSGTGFGVHGPGGGILPPPPSTVPPALGRAGSGTGFALPPSNLGRGVSGTSFGTPASLTEVDNENEDAEGVAAGEEAAAIAADYNSQFYAWQGAYSAYYAAAAAAASAPPGAAPPFMPSPPIPPPVPVSLSAAPEYGHHVAQYASFTAAFPSSTGGAGAGGAPMVRPTAALSLPPPQLPPLSAPSGPTSRVNPVVSGSFSGSPTKSFLKPKGPRPGDGAGTPPPASGAAAVDAAAASFIITPDGRRIPRPARPGQGPAGGAGSPGGAPAPPLASHALMSGSAAMRASAMSEQADAIRGVGTMAVAPEFQAFFEAQFAKKVGDAGSGSASHALKPTGPRKPAAASAPNDDDSDDEDDDDGGGGGAEESAAVAQAMMAIAAVSSKVSSKMERIQNAIALAKEKAEAMTSKEVVALWMPVTAGAAIQRNISNAMGSSRSLLSIRNSASHFAHSFDASSAMGAKPGSVMGKPASPARPTSVAETEVEEEQPVEAAAPADAGRLLHMPGVDRPVLLPPKPADHSSGGGGSPPAPTVIISAASAGIAPPPKPGRMGGGSPGGQAPAAPVTTSPIVPLNAVAMGIAPPPKPGKKPAPQ